MGARVAGKVSHSLHWPVLPHLPPPCHARSVSCLQIEGVGNIDQGMWKSGQGARSSTYSKASEGEGKRWECIAVSHHTSFTQAREGGYCGPGPKAGKGTQPLISLVLWTEVTSVGSWGWATG